MPTFIAVREQKSYGCDYSIACGKDHVIIEAADAQEAFRIMKNKFYWGDFEKGERGCDPFSPKNEHQLEYARLYEIKEEYTHIIEQWYDGVSAKLHAEADAEVKAKKEAEYEALKKELGK